MSEVTRIIERIKTGDVAASEQLLPLVYQELRRMGVLGGELGGPPVALLERGGDGAQSPDCSRAQRAWCSFAHSRVTLP